MPIIINTDKLYDTDLTDAAWALIGPMLPAAKIDTILNMRDLTTKGAQRYILHNVGSNVKKSVEAARAVYDSRKLKKLARKSSEPLPI